MNNIYQEFLAVLSEYLPNAANAFASSANLELLDRINERVDTKLPKDFLDFYKRANGEANYIGSILGFELMSIENIIGEYEFWLENSKKVMAYHRKCWNGLMDIILIILKKDFCKLV